MIMSRKTSSRPGVLHPNYQHGHACMSNVSPEYRSWQGMIARCYRRSGPDYPYYGGAGITVCNKWKKSFKSFLQDLGKRPSAAHTLDRIDGTGDYTPKNCRWATPVEQANNRKSNKRLSYNGKLLTIAQWARSLGNISPGTLRQRLKHGWTIKDAIETPVNHYFRKAK